MGKINIINNNMLIPHIKSRIAILIFGGDGTP
jgi:hypothetical protein